MTDDCFPDVNYFVNPLFSDRMVIRQPGGTVALFTPDAQEGRFFQNCRLNALFSASTPHIQPGGTTLWRSALFSQECLFENCNKPFTLKSEVHNFTRRYDGRCMHVKPRICGAFTWTKSHRSSLLVRSGKGLSASLGMNCSGNEVSIPSWWGDP